MGLFDRVPSSPRGLILHGRHRLGGLVLAMAALVALAVPMACGGGDAPAPAPAVQEFVITASAGANGAITPSGQVKVAKGASQAFTIAPAAGYVVDVVTVDGASAGAVSTYTFSNVQAAHSIHATFKASSTPAFTITASAGLNGAISPSGSVSVNQGADQTFTLTPASGYAVDVVTVDGASVGAVTTYTFSKVQAAHTIHATFKASSTPTFTITASAGANGTISPSGSVSVIQGADQTFTLTPASGYVVNGVTVDGASVGAVTSYTFSKVQAAHTISATFKAGVVSENLALGKTATASSTESATYPASAAVDGDAAISRWASSWVDPSWISIDLGSVLNFNHVILRWEAAFGKTYTIDVSSDGGTWTTVHTQPNGAGGAEDFFFPATSARYIRMNGTARTTIAGAQYGYSLFEFEVYNTVQYVITASAGAGGTISPSGEVTVNKGATPTFAITPSPGYAVKEVLVGGSSVGNPTSYTFPAVQANSSIAATFEALPSYLITTSAGANGTISPASASVYKGQDQAFAITPAAGYVVDAVTVDGVGVGSVTSYTFTNVQAPHSLAATFKAAAVYTFNASVNASADGLLHGTISPSGAVAVTQGTDRTFTMTPEKGYHVSALTVDGQAVSAAKAYTFKNVQAAHTIAVTFEVGNDYAWNDEFDGPYLDSSKWVFDLGNGPTGVYGWGNGEFESYTSAKDNISFEDGNLVITARKEDFGGYHFTSARLLTRGKYSFKHGHIEARIKFPTGGQMIWPCFWMMGDTSTGWPKTNEIDIAEMFGGTYSNPSGTYGDDVVSAHCFWWQENDFTKPYGPGNQADYGKVVKLDSPLGSAYRIYALDWDDTSLKAYVWEDGKTFQEANPTPYWTITIGGAGLEELHTIPDYLLLNFAIGQPNFGMTSVAQAAALPQKMYVDWVRVTDAGSTPAQVTDKVASQPHGNLGVVPDGTVCPTSLNFDSDANLYLWNNLTDVAPSREKGLAFKNTTSDWFGFGVATTARYNLVNYAAGALHVSIKTTSKDPIKIGIHGGADGDAWVTLTSGGTLAYDFARDGNWHDIVIPMTSFGGADFTDISQFFMVASGTTVTAGQTYEFDDIYWSESDPARMVKPTGNAFGILTATACDGGNYDHTTDGALNNWNPDNGTLAVGSLGANQSFSFAAPAGAWYGMGIAPTKLYDLSAFASGHLHFSMKVAPGSSSALFKIGLKSPGGTAVRESWIKMGSADHPVVADGAFHDYSIPAGEFCNSDLNAVSQLFMIAGDAGPMNLEIANVYWTAN